MDAFLAGWTRFVAEGRGTVAISDVLNFKLTLPPLPLDIPGLLIRVTALHRVYVTSSLSHSLQVRHAAQLNSAPHPSAVRLFNLDCPVVAASCRRHAEVSSLRTTGMHSRRICWPCMFTLKWAPGANTSHPLCSTLALPHCHPFSQ